MRRNQSPPPERFTIKDGVQILLGLIMLPLGIIITYNTFARGSAPAAILVGGSFVAFGIYRTSLAAFRLRWYYSQRRSVKHE
jgi:hypothetical protein